MTRHILPTIAAVFALVISTSVLADTDEPPLYVGPTGLDSGNCLDPASPCQTIDFALQRVGKYGRIRIAAGNYTLSNPGDVFYLVSGAIDVRADKGAALIGVPHAFAGDLAALGFRVIADSKGLSRATADKLTDTRTAVNTNAFATACVGGSAAGFPCNNVDLHAHIVDRASSSQGADIWGFVDLNTNREYAIMGYSTGTAVYDVTDPANPREVGFVDGQPTSWRDIKVYQFWNAGDNRWNAYAYVTADNASDGLFVLDLTRLPHSITRASYPSDFAEAHNVYISKTDFSTGLALTDDTPVLVIAGSNISDGRFRNYSLNNPVAPSFIAAPATPASQPAGNRLYIHDAASMTVTDARKDTQCSNAGASDYCDVLFDFNESTLDIWDITDPVDPVRLSQTPYSNASYTHSGWWSEDQQYVFLQDELDERDRGLPTTLRVFSIADLRNPTLAGTWTGPTSAIDHNGFARGNRYYMSNYARGLTILDITDPASPTTVGRFDTFPSGDATGFPGAWGTYPFLPSGNVLISDIDSGFYVVDDNTRDVAQGSLSFATASFAADESQAANIVVQRLGGSAGAIGVNWEVFGASGSLADVSVANGTLNWSAGDATDKVISLGIDNDGVAEGLERLMIKLTAPGGGATLSSPSIASVYVSDPGSTSTIDFASARIAVPERGFGLAVAVMQRSGSATGAASVDFAITDGDASAGSDYTGSAGGTVNWADGDADPKWIEYEISDDGSGEPDEFIELTLGNATGAALGANTALRIDLLDGTGSNAAPNAVAGANQTVDIGAQVTLNGGSSNDPDGDALTYLWTQTMGPAVTLSNADMASASFTAPTVTSATLFRFNLGVTDPDGLNDSADVSVTVTANAPGIGGSGGGGAISLWLLALLLFERMRLDNRLFAIRSR